MNRCFIAFVLLIVIASAILINDGILHQYTTVLLTTLDEISYSVSKNDYEKAKFYASQFYEDWHKKKPYLSAVIKHDEIDNIESSIEKICEYIIVEEKNNLSAELAVLTFFLEHIYSSQVVNFENVF